MSYSNSSSINGIGYSSNSKSSKLFTDLNRQRKTPDTSWRDRASKNDRPDNDSSNFLRSTMGSYNSRPNRQLFESAAIQGERKKQFNLRHTTGGNLSDILKNLNFDKQPKEQPIVSNKYSTTNYNQSTGETSTTLPVGVFRKQKHSYSTLYESKPATNYDNYETKKQTPSKMNVDEIFNKLKRERQLENQLKKLKEQKKLREERQKQRQRQRQKQRQKQKQKQKQREKQRQKSSKTSSSLSNLLSSQGLSSAFSKSPRPATKVSTEDQYSYNRTSTETYTSLTSNTTTNAIINDYEKKYEYNFSKKTKPEYGAYTPKRQYDFQKKYGEITKKADTGGRQYDWKKTTESPIFLKETKSTSIHVEKSSTSYTKSPIASSKKEDTFSKYFSPSNSQKSEKFDCKVTLRDFKLGKSLGQGKFGIVYQAIHKQTNSLYALKKVPKALIKSHYMIDQFILQLKLQTFMNSEHLLALYGFFHDAQHIYLILDYMEEGTLYAMLKKKKKLDYTEAAGKIKQIAKGIIYMHENGIAHRDIKPQNVVMSYGSCKLCDFGWSTICDQRRKTYCGTFDYAAPEILEGAQYDMTVDLWCLGVLAYELLVGKAPFYHIKKQETKKRILNVQSEPIIFPPQMPRDAVDFIDRLLKKDPDERIKNDELLVHPFLAKL